MTRFEAIAQYVASHDAFNSLSPSEQLHFYGLYKSSQGKAPQHTVWKRTVLFLTDYQGYLKWASWDTFSDTYTPDEAREKYCALATSIGAYPSPQQLRMMEGSQISVMMEEQDSLSSDMDALIDACRGDNVDVIRDFLNGGGDVNVKNEEGTRLLHFAVDSNASSVVHFLLERHVQIDVLDDQGQTPLHIAAINGEGWKRIAQELIIRHADTTIRNEEGLTVKDVLVQSHLNPRHWLLF